MAPEIIFEIICFGIAMVLAQIFHSFWVLLVPILGAILLLSSFFTLYWAPFVPSNNSKLKTMIALAKIKKGERVYDLGAGNGKIVNAAAQVGAKATGYEISVPLVVYYYIKRMMGLVKGRVLWGNMFNQDISDADIVFCYLFPHTVKNISKKLFGQLNPGTRVISNAFEIEGMVPEKISNQVYLYIIK